MTWTIRPTLAADRNDVLALVGAAFTRDGHDGREEVRIVARTWELGVAPADLDLVAVEEGGLVIGHVLTAPGRLRGVEAPEAGAPGDRHALAVAPLAVLPSRQGQGVGSSLMREVLSRAQRSGAPMVLLLGDPAYYGRFGFEAADRYGVSYPPVGSGDPHFMLRPLTSLGEEWCGAFTFCWEEGGG